MKEYDKAIVSCKRIAHNPCGPDEYEVTIKPHGEPEQVIYTLVGPFESDEAISTYKFVNHEERAYHQKI